MERWDWLLLVALSCPVLAAFGVDWRLGLVVAGVAVAVVWHLLEPVEEG